MPAQKLTMTRMELLTLLGRLAPMVRWYGHRRAAKGYVDLPTGHGTISVHQATTEAGCWAVTCHHPHVLVRGQHLPTVLRQAIREFEAKQRASADAWATVTVGDIAGGPASEVVR